MAANLRKIAETQPGELERDDAQREGPIGTLARGLTVLEVLFAAPQPMGLSEIAGNVELEQSTTLRLLRTLEESGYVVRSGETKKYMPSPKAVRPLQLLHPLEQLRRETRDIIQELAQQVGQTVVLVLYLGTERMVLDLAQGPSTLNPYYGTWLTGPLHGTGPGKCLLSTLDIERRHRLLGPEPLQKFTDLTPTTYQAIDQDLEASRERGYFVARDEYQIGITSIASNILTWQGEAVGCLAVTAPSRGLSEDDIKAIGKETRQAADQILYHAQSLGPAAQYCGH